MMEHYRMGMITQRTFFFSIFTSRWYDNVDVLTFFLGDLLTFFWNQNSKQRNRFLRVLSVRCAPTCSHSVIIVPWVCAFYHIFVNMRTTRAVPRTPLCRSHIPSALVPRTNAHAHSSKASPHTAPQSNFQSATVPSLQSSHISDCKSVFLMSISDRVVENDFSLSRFLR